MKKPAMILFDFGDTICVNDREPDFLHGTIKLMELADDTNGIAPEVVQEFADELLKSIFEDGSQRIQICEQSFNRFLYQYFGIKFSKTPLELERAFWDYSFRLKPASGIKELFALMDAQGIRKAILSNNAFEESTVRYELDKYFTDTEFDFVISTADYCFMKPSPLIFNLALRMARLEKEDVWYAGNSMTCDVAGANSAGIFPIWYNTVNAVLCDEYKDIRHLEVNDWQQLMGFLKTL